jgi:type II secretory pathway component GspD/PulD (secretin)
MKTILKKIPVIIPAFLFLLIGAGKTTSCLVAEETVERVVVAVAEETTESVIAAAAEEEAATVIEDVDEENAEAVVVAVAEETTEPVIAEAAEEEAATVIEDVTEEAAETVSIEQAYTSEGIRKRDIKRKNDKIIVKNQKTEDISKITISDDARKQMLLDAKRATKEERYEDALKIANAILEVKSDDKSAIALKENAQLLMQDRRHNEVMNQLDRVDTQERNKYFESLREKSIPYTDLMTFTTEEKWEDIKKRILKEDPNERLDESREHTERLQVAPSPSQNIISQEIGNALNKTLSIEFINTPLSDVVVFLQEKTKVNFVLDKDAAATSVSVKLDGVPVSTVLDYIVPEGLDYVVKKDNVVHITLDPLELRVYDARDLLINLEDRQSLNAEARITEEGINKGEAKDTFDRVQEIINLIIDTVEPASWSINGGRGRIAAREGMLGDIVVTHVAGVHKQIEDLLAALRSSADLQIAIEARFIQVSDNFLETIGHNILDFDATPESPSKRRGSDGTPESNDSGGVNPGIFSAAGETFSETGVVAGAAGAAGSAGLNLTYQIFNGFFLKGFLKAVQESDEAEIVTAPNITLSNTQRGTIKVVTTTSYIASYTIVSQTPQPVMEEIDSGTTFNVRPVVSADRKYVYLEVHPVITSVDLTTETDFETAGVTPSGGGAATVATNKIIRPITVKQELSVTVCVPDKGVLMIGGLGKSTETKRAKGVPILSKIPIIKRLFSSKTIDRDITTADNLIILVKPTILIREEQEARAFANKGKDIEFISPLK